ncbi:thioredoxin-2-like [Eriocheir sinensis]|uniref:Thioredoxin n=1 Tax=Eriocheir sinensis TaxID=95602 RepID=C4N5V0_ERISI|nr:thioredoxin-2-like [Eriocheir sinensis]ACQ59118.1 Trx1 [Eriocheir sinensis]
MVYQVKDQEDFKKQLKEAGQKLVVVDFYATWCGPCKMIAPKLQEMSSQMTDVVFLKVDVDECEDVAVTYQISCMPTFLFFKEEQKIDSFSGASEEKIRDYIAKYK